MEKRLFVSFNCIFTGTKEYRDSVLESIRSSYDKGDKVNEQDVLNGINWYKEYTKICDPNKDSLKALKLYRQFVVVARTLCTGEREAQIRMLKDFGYSHDVYSISIKKKGDEILDTSKPEQHYGDILSNGFAILGNSLIDNNVNELHSWNVRGGQSFYFDSLCDECDFRPEFDSSAIHTINKLTVVPKILGLSKK